MLPALALAAFLALPPARVEVLDGRAELAHAGGVTRLAAGRDAERIAGPLYCELPAGSRARIDWPGVASLELDGPATLEWSPRDTATRALRIRVFACQRMSFETRRAELELECAGGWRFELVRGAGELECGRAGVCELDFDAGLPARVSAPSSERLTWPPRTLLPGATVLLIPGASAPVASAGSARRVLDLFARPAGVATQTASSAPAWRGRAWPWAS